MIDLRSDTVTRPTPGMRAAMAAAEVGDDVYDEDPTVHRLEERIAAMLGKEAALFVPTGTMGNQIGVRVHCQPGDEFLCDADCHVFNHEQAAYAQLFGIAARPVVATGNVMRVSDLEDKVRADDVHFPRTRLLCVENTHNRAGGMVYPRAEIENICAWAAAHGLVRHLDGARLFNAVVATGTPASEWVGHFDTVSVCFSKGLGAPVGSALVGPRDAIQKARRLRKALGGGWRQAGILAAAALYALDHHIERLAEDHANARRFAAVIGACEGLELDRPHVETNIVIFRIDERLGTATDFCSRMAQRGVQMGVISKQKVRAVFHLDVSRQDAEGAVELLQHATPAR